MPRNLNISKDIEFVGVAAHNKNVVGPMQESRIHTYHCHSTLERVEFQGWYQSP